MSLEQAIEHAERAYKESRNGLQYALKRGETKFAERCEKDAEEYGQLAELLRELQERRKAPEIVQCGECTHYIPILSNWGKCGVHCSPTEKYRTCQICDYCSWAEKREEKSKWAKNPYVQCR